MGRRRLVSRRLDVPIVWGGRAAIVEALLRRSRARPHRQLARVRLTTLRDGTPTKHGRTYIRPVRGITLPNGQTLAAFLRARKVPDDERAEVACLKRARRNVEAARAKLATIARRVKRLETSAKAWRRKLAARERALSALLDASAPPDDEIMARMSGFTLASSS